MKNWYLTLFACLLAFGSRGQADPFGLTVVSQETPAGSGTLSF